uniref:Uncharacterized protein n=1 Tax=Candidatus Kentrum sp. LPFa TaxID=2126335 RepID=A0A450VSV3_9GAMM|nr:MAG: hypothetical protein BECKLPF1236B_GA0070989_100316 [Candidatus Kentron sp. LPFa]
MLYVRIYGVVFMFMYRKNKDFGNQLVSYLENSQLPGKSSTKRSRNIKEILVTGFPLSRE